ncbi:hypothetical protein F8M41_017976 [Gigaspora margarita]|uniref:Integrase catalytic domain-containing protein n=1 Tax=Gigaspora margarita TaxID=4874 RepID=A0A8H4ELS9_GIGMA|nr:hypothetical protein F8M41_017976 [Gigaspora margarita]
MNTPYLQSKKVPETIHDPVAKCKFEHYCSKFELDENEILYLFAIVKDSKIIFDKHHIVPKYDLKLYNLLLKNFHNQSNHQSYYKTFLALSDKHIGITQTKVQAYINKCSVCAINSSIKAKTDMKLLLTCVCIFLKYLIAIPIKNKEAGTIATHLVKDVFRIPGLLTIFQSDNGKEFEKTIKQDYEAKADKADEADNTDEADNADEADDINNAKIVVNQYILQAMQIQEVG